MLFLTNGTGFKIPVNNHSKTLPQMSQKKSSQLSQKAKEEEEWKTMMQNMTQFMDSSTRYLNSLNQKAEKGIAAKKSNIPDAVVENVSKSTAAPVLQSQKPATTSVLSGEDGARKTLHTGTQTVSFNLEDPSMKHGVRDRVPVKSATVEEKTVQTTFEKDGRHGEDNRQDLQTLEHVTDIMTSESKPATASDMALSIGDESLKDREVPGTGQPASVIPDERRESPQQVVKRLEQQRAQRRPDNVLFIEEVSAAKRQHLTKSDHMVYIPSRDAKIVFNKPEVPRPAVSAPKDEEVESQKSLGADAIEHTTEGVKKYVTQASKSVMVFIEDISKIDRASSQMLDISANVPDRKEKKDRKNKDKISEEERLRRRICRCKKCGIPGDIHHARKPISKPADHKEPAEKAADNTNADQIIVDKTNIDNTTAKEVTETTKET